MPDRKLLSEKLDEKRLKHCLKLSTCHKNEVVFLVVIHDNFEETQDFGNQIFFWLQKS